MSVKLIIDDEEDSQEDHGSKRLSFVNSASDTTDGDKFVLDLEGESSDESEVFESHTQKVMRQLNRTPGPSSLKFSSRLFMFPEDREKTRVSSRENEKIESSEDRHVTFGKLTKFLCYKLSDDKNKPNEVKEKCEVYLLTGHLYKNFEEEFIKQTAQVVLSDPETALDYWSRIMREGKQVIFGSETVDGVLNHVSILGKYQAGVLPLLPEIEEEMMQSLNAPRKGRQGLSFKGIGKSISRTMVYRVEDNFDLESSYSGDSVEEELVEHIYIRTLKNRQEARESLSKIKDRTDLSLLKKYQANFNEDFKKYFVAKGDGENLENRRQIDFNYLSEIAEGIVMTKANLASIRDRDIFDMPAYLNIIVGSITLKNYIAAFSDAKCMKYFRKVFASPCLNPGHGNYKKYTFSHGKDVIRGMFETLELVCYMIEDVEQLLDSHYRDKEEEEKFDGAGVSDSFEWLNFGSFLVYDKDKGICKDLFSGTVFELTRPNNVRKSRLIVKRLLSQGRSIKKKKRFPKSANVKIPKRGEKFPRPQLILPAYFEKLCTLFVHPIRFWNSLKLKWTEIYLSIVNTGIVTAVLNNNLPLLKCVEEIKYPNCIVQTSILSTEPSFFTGHSRSKESLRTAGVYKIARTGPLIGGNIPYLTEYQYGYGYISKEEGDIKAPAVPLKTPLAYARVDSLSVILNPVVRADLYASRIRNASDYVIGGHSGMLMAKAIRVNAVHVRDYLFKRGLEHNMKVSTGDALTLRWDFDPEERRKAYEKRKQKGARLSGKQGSMNFIASAKNLIAPQKSILEESNEQVGVDNSMKELADEKALKDNKVEPVSLVDAESEKDAERLQKTGREKSGAKRLADISKVGSGSFLLKDKQKNTSDEAQVENNRKICLVSNFQKQTLLTIAVEGLTNDIFEPHRAVTLDEFMALPVHEKRKLEELSIADIKEIDERYDSFLDILGRGATVLDCDGAAIRACLPVITIMSQGLRLQKLEERRLMRSRLANASHMNNMTMTPRDMKNLKKQEKKSKRLQRFSVVDFLNGGKTLPTSSKVIGSRSFRTITKRKYFKESNHAPFEARRRYAAAYVALHTMNKITTKAIEEIKQMREEQGKVRDNGLYAAITIRVMFVHEGIKQGQWDTVRYLCPFKVDHALTGELERAYPDAEVQEVTAKEIDLATGEVLNQVVKLLLKDIKKSLNTTTCRGWNGIYFILREYNVTLARTTMNALIACAGLCFTRNVGLKAGDKAALEKILCMRQMKAFLKIQEYEFYDNRQLENYGFARNRATQTWFNKLKNIFGKHMDEATVIPYIYMYSYAESMTKVTDLFRERFLEGLDKRILKEMISHCILIKERAGMYQNLVDICRRSGIDQKVYKGVFNKVLEKLIPANDYTRMSTVNAKLALELLQNNLRPKSVDECFRIMCRMLSYPLMDTEQRYNNELCATDLSVYHLFEEFCSFLFFDDNVLRTAEEKIGMFETIIEQLVKYNVSYLWIQGIDRLMMIGRDLYQESGYTSGSKGVRKMIKYLRKEQQWEMQYDRERRTLKMVYIDHDKDYEGKKLKSTKLLITD